MIVIHHVTLMTPKEVLPDGALIIEGGKIRALGPAKEVRWPEGAHEIDGTGLVLSPGFIELQINGGFGEDFTGQPESIWTVAAQLPQFGVTSFLPTIVTSPLDTIRRAMKVFGQDAPDHFVGAIPLGLHVEGPFLNPGKKGAHNPGYIRPPDARLVTGWSPAAGIRMVTLAPEKPGALDMVRQLRENGVVVSAGHSLATYEQAVEAFRAGITYGTHLFNAHPPLDHRKPGLSGALLTHPEVAVGLIVDGIHVHPAMVNLAWKAKGPGGITLVTDAMAALGMPPGRYILGDVNVIVDPTSARLVDGTLAGSVLKPDSGLRNLMAFTGCSLAEALQTLTSTPARVLGMEQKGRLEVGCDADLVLLTPDGHVKMTFIAGVVAYDPEHLAEMERNA